MLKKYLVTLIPFIICGALSLCISSMDPNPAHPYRTAPVLGYLALVWFYIGIVYSLMFFVIILLDDVFNKLQRFFCNRRLLNL
jgi:hypothetical protein